MEATMSLKSMPGMRSGGLCKSTLNFYRHLSQYRYTGPQHKQIPNLCVYCYMLYEYALCMNTEAEKRKKMSSVSRGPLFLIFSFAHFPSLVITTLILV
jgi:hypothetical protein